MEIINLLLSNSQIDINNTGYDHLYRVIMKNSILNFKIKNRYYEEETALMVAIMNNNLNVINLLLSREDIDPNDISIYFNQYKEEKTSLFGAIEKSNPEIIKLLLSHLKIDVNCFSKFTKNECIIDEKYIEKAPIHLAVEMGNIEIIKLITSHPLIDINSNEKIKQVQKKAALHIAIENKNIEVLKHLLTIPSLNINLKMSSEKCKFTCLNYDDYYKEYYNKEYLANCEYEEKIEYMNIIKRIKKIIDCDDSDISDLVYDPLLKHYINFINVLLYDENADLYPVFQAIKKKNSPKEEHIIYEMKTPLYIAVENANLEIANLLLSKSDIDIDLKSEFTEQNTYYCQNDKRGVRYFYKKNI